MLYWILAATGLICAIAVGIAIWQRRRIGQYEARDAECEQIRIDIEGIRRENIDLRREIAALNRDLDEEQAYSDSLAEEIDHQQAQLQHAMQRAENAETRRTDAEKEIYAGRMRISQLEQQLKQAYKEQANQEQLYQDIIRDRDQTIQKLQENSPKRRKKKPDILDQQITLDDIMKEA